MRRKRLRRLLRRDFGKKPDALYFPGDMDEIRAYARHRRAAEPGRFQLDDVTWNDLDMDRLFQRLNPRLSTAGEQYLYWQLHAPAQDEASWNHLRGLIRLMAEDEALRLEVQVILARLGSAKYCDLERIFAPTPRASWRLILYVALLAILVICAVAAVFLGRPGLMALIASALVNTVVHELCRRKSERDYSTVNYTVQMVMALHRLRKLRHPALDKALSGAWAHLEALRSVRRMGGVSAASGSSMADTLTSVLLADLITYEGLRHTMGEHPRDVFAVHEALGQLDTAIAIASWRRTLPRWTEPEVDFRPGKAAFEARSLVHPLLDDAAPNDLMLGRSLLLTGSNASGKSTCLKAAALCAVTAQALCTCTADKVRMSALRVMTSMALRDDMLSGESYYIVETRSLKRIFDAGEGLPVFCAIDEVLRGTNTIERIAASCEILRSLARQGILCIAATHDIELCDLLGEDYDLAHFEEQVTEQSIAYDYRLRPGKAVTRNAIHLLRLIGFDQSIVDGAHARAQDYLETGRWRQ